MKFEAKRTRGVDALENKIFLCASVMAKAGRNQKLLDVGCGDGRITIEFARNLGAKECFGIEVDEKSIDKAVKRGINVKQTDLNSSPLPFSDNSFSVVLCNQVAEHLTNPDNLFQEVWRVLLPGGYFLISVPNLCSLHNRLFMLLGWHPTVITPSTKFSFGNPVRGEQLESSTWHRHNTAFSPAGLKEMLKYYGFKNEHYYGVTLFPLPERIAQVILTLFPGLGGVQIVLAKKIVA